jgi:citrate synthase
LILLKIDFRAREVDRQVMTITPTSAPSSSAGSSGPASESAPGELPVPLVAPPGLKGVVVADTAIGDVRGAEGFFHYRQYSAVELAATRTFEDVWHLLLFGRLPDAVERESFLFATAPRRTLPRAVLAALPAIAASGASPLSQLATALALTGGVLGLRPMLDIDEAERLDDALALVAVVPTIVAALHRLGLGLVPIEPDPALSHAADYLRMLTGEAPGDEQARAVDAYLVLTADHGFNASTFTGRVIASTGADLGACVVGALGALSGPLHGGAPSRALDLLDEIGEPSRSAAVVEDKIGRGERIMGFGHAVYAGEDPRSVLLREIAGGLGGPQAELARTTEAAVVETLARLKPDRDLRTNVEFYAGVVMERCGIPRELFTSTFAVSRTAGWCAHALEQAAAHRLIRPSARYTGPAPAVPVPTAEVR